MILSHIISPLLFASPQRTDVNLLYPRVITSLDVAPFFLHMITECSFDYLHYVCNFIRWAHGCIERKPRRQYHVMIPHQVHCTLRHVEHIEESRNSRRNVLCGRDVPSICLMSSVRISGRQFFPSEGVCQTD